MATRAKDANVKKDKKPLASSLAQRQWKPKPLASQLGSDDKVKSSSSSSSAATNPARKPAPNYLKPTLSSKPETLTRTTKKSTTTTSANKEDKARLVRRRSLDRPPSLSRQDSAASRLRTSSLFKSTGSSSNRTASSVHKPGGSRLMNTALKSQLPLRRSSSSSAPVSSATSPTKTDEAGLGSDAGNKLEETIEEGLVCSDAETEQVHPDELETSEDQNPPQEALVEETEGELLDGTEEEELENLNHGDEKSQAEDGSPDEARVSDQDKGEENVVEGQELAASNQPAAEEVKEEEEEEEGAHDEATRGDQVEEEEVQEQEEETPAGSVQKREVVQGKKESPSAYNDVIEETKNKLLETRKNKVKALVGAFETVIDYESGSK